MVNGRQTKILFIAMDRGGKGELGRRADEETFADAQQSFRQDAKEPKNPHMGGVHLILSELIEKADPTLFSHQYALTNAVKCARKTSKMVTGVTGKMIRNCSNYLLAEIDSLGPDLIVTQGSHPATTMTRLLHSSGLEFVQRFKGDPKGRAEVFQVRSPQCVLLTTPHPARLKDLSWRNKTLPTFLLSAIQCSISTLDSLAREAD